MTKDLHLIIKILSAAVLFVALSQAAVGQTDFEKTKQLAEQGVISAQYKLGLMYGYGNGITQNNREAVRWYAVAAEQGHAKAQYNLGLMYSKGNGVSVNHVEAVKWYRKAAEQGNDGAQTNLGVKYYHGEGVPENYVLAYMWWNLAAAQGADDARKHRSIIRSKMTRSQLERAQELSSAFKPVKTRNESSVPICGSSGECANCPNNQFCSNGRPIKPGSGRKRLLDVKGVQGTEKNSLVDKEVQRQIQPSQVAGDRPTEERRLEEIALQQKFEHLRLTEEQRRIEEQAVLEKIDQVHNRRRADKEFSKFRASIHQKVSRNWSRPSGSRSGLKAVALVKVRSNGEVISARVVTGSGDPIFDLSLEDALFKASPLPVPADRMLYEYFKEFMFELNPDSKLY